MPETTSKGQLLAAVRTLIGVAVLSGLAVSFTISFVSFIYAGDLAEHLGNGIGLALMGMSLMLVVAALLSSFKGVMCHAQDAPALLLGTAAAAIVVDIDGDPNAIFPTVATFLAVASLLTGLALLVAGYFRLGALARFIPYSVIGGFLAATGILLVLGAIGMISRQPVSVWDLSAFSDADAIWQIYPWIAFSIGVVCLGRIFSGSAVLPTSIATGAIAFFVCLTVFDISLQDALQLGLMLGPFEGDTFLTGLTPSLPFDARWDLIFAQIPTLAAVVCISALGLLLNSSGLEIDQNTVVDFEKELNSAGFANIAAGAVGGMPGYHFLSETIFARRMGLTSPLGAIVVSGTAMLTLWIGADIVALAPVGLMASVIMILGFDLMYEWLWVQSRRLPRADVVIIYLIVATAVTMGFLQSLTLGLIAAVVFFVLSYAKTDIVQLQSSGAVRRSSVERSPSEMAKLTAGGTGWIIYELRDYMFFGSANKLYERLRDKLQISDGLDRVVLNFSKVSGADTSALFALSRMNDMCQQAQVTLVFSGLSPDLARQFDKTDGLGQAPVFPTLDAALIDTEAAFLAQSQDPTDVDDIFGSLKDAHTDVDFNAFTKIHKLSKGAALVEENSTSTDIFQVTSGTLTARVQRADGGQTVVAHFLTGAIVGEIAAITGMARSATIIAETDAEVTTISMKDIPQTPAGLSLQADLSKRLAEKLARRLIRMNNLVRDTQF